ncbi:PhnD/SsuA/transferrin family substrate-binding protein [Escherichia coli]|nr:PhnD/SsuA/transferrin family substrate-binding protein [Escherichia coli]
MKSLIYFGMLIFFMMKSIAVISAEPVNEPTKHLISIGVFADRGMTEAREKWQPTINWLKQEIPEYDFRLIPLPLSQLQHEISQQNLQFIIVNPSESIRIGRVHSLSWMATLISPMQGGTTTATGSAMWVKENSPFTDLLQLSGKPIGTAHRQAFGGFMAMERELHQMGVSNRYFSHVQEIGYPHESVVQAFLAGKIQAAILPVCLVESMIEKHQLEEKALRALNNIAPESFGCQVSTRLYPNWSFAMTGAADRTLGRKILTALLAVPSQSEVAKAAQSLGWTVPESQAELDRLFKDLGIHPLEQPWWIKLWEWIKSRYYLLIVIGIALIILPLQYIFLRMKYRKSTLSLQQALENLQYAQRRALVNKLGSSLAHELSQPLSAIHLYAEGELSRRKRGDHSTDIDVLLDKIRHQVIRINQVVDRFRQLLRKQAIQKTPQDLAIILQQAIKLVEIYAKSKQVELILHIDKQKMLLKADKAGIEQLMVNLFTNAIDASAQAGACSVSINLLYTENKAHLTVRDRGAGLQLPLEELMTPFVTTKADGIGLGLVICKEIAESHRSTFLLQNHPDGGCEASVIFTLYHNHK